MGTLTVSRLHELLHYDPETGTWVWLVARTAKAKIGTVAGRLHHTGYRHIGIDGRRYAAHRLAWLYMTGKWPAAQIDHVNLIRDDNRWCNLREATRSENFFNRRVQCDSVSGIKGLRQLPSGNWGVRATIDGRHQYLGTFPCAELAAFVRSEFVDAHHGEFGRNGYTWEH